MSSSPSRLDREADLPYSADMTNSTPIPAPLPPMPKTCEAAEARVAERLERDRAAWRERRAALIRSAVTETDEDAR